MRKCCNLEQKVLDVRDTSFQRKRLITAREASVGITRHITYGISLQIQCCRAVYLEDEGSHKLRQYELLRHSKFFESCTKVPLRKRYIRDCNYVRTFKNSENSSRKYRAARSIREIVVSFVSCYTDEMI